MLLPLRLLAVLLLCCFAVLLSLCLLSLCCTRHPAVTVVFRLGYSRSCCRYATRIAAAAKLLCCATFVELQSLSRRYCGVPLGLLAVLLPLCYSQCCCR